MPQGPHIHLVDGHDGRHTELVSPGGGSAHAWEVTDLAMSRDGRLVAAASSEGHLYVSTVEGQPWLRPLHRAPLHAIAFSPQSEQVAVACSDGTVRNWSVAERRIERLAEDVFRELIVDERREHLGR